VKRKVDKQITKLRLSCRGCLAVPPASQSTRFGNLSAHMAEPSLSCKAKSHLSNGVLSAVQQRGRWWHGVSRESAVQDSFNPNGTSKKLTSSTEPLDRSRRARKLSRNLISRGGNMYIVHKFLDVVKIGVRYLRGKSLCIHFVI
jgi:hypothetical protein